MGMAKCTWQDRSCCHDAAAHRADILPPQVPKRIEFVDALPRNAMGKVNKKQLLRDFFAQ